MITQEQYFGGKPHTEAEDALATDLLMRVNILIADAVGAGAFTMLNDPDTGSQISGSKGGSGDGGFRLPNATTGAPNSSHKQARAVDVYDPQGKLDAWITDEKLEVYGLYREAPEATFGWVHLTTRPPNSKKRTFTP